MVRRGVNKVHSIRFFPVVLPGVPFISTFDLNNNNVQFQVKSITLDWLIRDNVTNQIIPEAQNDVIEITFGTAAGNTPNSLPMLNVLGTAAFITGSNFWFHTKGQRIFDSFFLQNTLGLFVQLINRDPANAYQIYFTVITEIESLA